MSLSFTIQFYPTHEDSILLIAHRSDDERLLVGSFTPPFEPKQLEPILKVLEGLNRDDRLNLGEEDELILLEIKDKDSPNEPYWDIDNSRPSPDLPKRVGRRLYQALFCGEVGYHFQKARDDVLGADEAAQINLCLQFRPDDPISMRYPWELMCKSLYVPLLILEKVILTRHVVSDDTCPPLRFDSINMIMVRPRPKDAPQLSVSDGEAVKRMLEEELDEPNKINLLDTVPSLEALIETVVNKKSVNLIHYDGHGIFGRYCPNCEKQGRKTFVEWYHPRCSETECQADLSSVRDEGFLVFEDSQRCSHFVSPSQLDPLAHRGIMLFVLNACQTATIGHGSVFNSIAPKLVQAGIPAVVGMQFSVKEEEAHKFSQQLYKSLLNHQLSIGEAVADARRLLSEEERFRPVLYLKTRLSTTSEQHVSPVPVDLNHQVQRYRVALATRLKEDATRQMNVLDTEDYIGSTAKVTL